MASNHRNIWGIRAGNKNEAKGLFLDEGYIALGWELGDLSKLPADREEFKKHYASFRPHASAGHIGQSAAQVYNFVHEIEQGDIVVYPSVKDKMVHIGRVVGPYIYDASGDIFRDGGFTSRRKVKWLRHVRRDQVTQGAHRALGNRLTVFRIKDYADEFRTDV